MKAYSDDTHSLEECQTDNRLECYELQEWPVLRKLGFQQRVELEDSQHGQGQRDGSQCAQVGFGKLGATLPLAVYARSCSDVRSDSDDKRHDWELKDHDPATLERRIDN